MPRRCSSITGLHAQEWGDPNPSSIACKKFTKVLPLTLKSSVTLYLHRITLWCSLESQNVSFCARFYGHNRRQTQAKRLTTRKARGTWRCKHRLININEGNKQTKEGSRAPGVQGNICYGDERTILRLVRERKHVKFPRGQSLLRHKVGWTWLSFLLRALLVG